MDVNDNGMFDKPFGWAGNSHASGRQVLIRPATVAARVGILSRRAGSVPRRTRLGDRADARQHRAMLKSFTIPGEDVLAASTAAKSKPGTFALHPGSGIKIDVNGVPEDRRAETHKVLEERLHEVGFVPDPKAAVTLFASVDTPGTKPTVVYSGLGSYQYTKKMARLRLVHKDKELWNEAWAVEPPFAIELAGERC